MFMVFNATEHIRALTNHFDDLIRTATVQPRDVAPFLRGLREALDSDPDPDPGRGGETRLGERQKE